MTEPKKKPPANDSQAPVIVLMTLLIERGVIKGPELRARLVEVKDALKKKRKAPGAQKALELAIAGIDANA